jgi:hypothetical protein
VTRVRLAALLATATLVAAGCSDDEPRPRLEPTESASPTESPSPTPTYTASPARVGAVDAVRGWVQERNRALESGDTTALRALTAPGCASCEPYIDLIEDVYEAGGRYETAGWSVDNAKELQPRRVTAAITMGGGLMIATAGGDPEEYAEEKAIFRFRLVQQAGGPVISFIGLVR